MWSYLAIQGLLFFLFFQPDLVSSRAVRVLLVAVGVLAIISSYLFADMDPFVWILYALGIALTYRMAQKALRWVAVNRQNMREEITVIEAKSRDYNREVAERDARVKTLQDEINQVSHMYDKVKEMSRALEFLDVFIDLSEVLMGSFGVRKSRLILVAQNLKQGLTIERVYQIDHRYLQFSAQDKGALSQDVMFRGEVYPFDLRLLEILEKESKPFTIWSGGENAAASSDRDLKLPTGMGSFTAIPVRTGDGLSAILTLEGLERRNETAIAILADRFIAEFKRIKLYADVQRLAITDWLTGAYVRRHFFKRLEEELSRSARFNLKFSFLMIDLDAFKALNDRHGHLAGDAVLRQTADVIKKTLREVDLVGRYGGEEFAAILLDTDENGAMYVAERIRKAIEQHDYRAYDLSLKMTASIGVATFSAAIREPGEIVEWADSALYQAKRQGKNRVCAYINR